MALTYSQVLANIMSFEAKGLAFIDSPINLKDKRILRDLILNLKGVSEENKNENVFISVEKNYKGNIILLYKKIYHKDISTIADYLSIVMIRKFGEEVLSIFKPYYQDLAKDVV